MYVCAYVCACVCVCVCLYVCVSVCTQVRIQAMLVKSKCLRYSLLSKTTVNEHFASSKVLSRESRPAVRHGGRLN